jgi:hypothetical protein
MADNQSRVIIEKGNGETTTYAAGNLEDALAIENAPKIKPTNQRRELPHLSIKVDVDISDALTGLKALQREAREATKALRELENAREISTTIELDGKTIARIVDELDIKTRLRRRI